MEEDTDQQHLDIVPQLLPLLVTTAVTCVDSVFSSPSQLQLILHKRNDDDTLIFYVSNVIKERLPYGSNQHVRVQEYVAQVAMAYNIDDFRAHFRVNKDTVEYIMQSLGNMQNECGRPHLPLLTLVLLGIWVLANQESFRGIGDRFGLERGHTHRCFRKFCEQMLLHKAKYIAWPEGRCMTDTIISFNELRERAFPNVVGAIDGSHIPIKCPEIDPSSYYNRKGYHSVNVQAVCAADMMFTDIFAGWPGSSNDARVWRMSPLCNAIVNGTVHLPDNCHLIGDSAYPLSDTLLTPYRDTGYLTRKQKNYNRTLSSSRVVIEQAFGLLKGRFRRLKFLDMCDRAFVPKVIATACILHNICIRHSDTAIDTDGNVDEEAGIGDGVQDIAIYDQASHKRDAIADMLSE